MSPTPEMVINELVTCEIEKVLGDRTTADERRELAARTIKIIDDYNRTVAIAAMEKAKNVMVSAAVESAAKESSGQEGR